MALKKLWTEKHRPKTLDGYVFQNEQQKQQLERMISSGDIPNLLLTGTQGSGKTTIAEILIHELGIDDVDVMRFNASDKTGVENVRDNIISFAESYPLGKFKIVKLEEFDYLSLNAQGMLRAVMEENSDSCRFICTCNYENKIIPALKSRMQHLRFKTPIYDDVLMRMMQILMDEEVEFDPEILAKYVDQAYPDIRKIINNLQLNTHESKLQQPTTDADGDDYQFKLIDLIIAGDLKGVRKLVCEQCSSEQIGEVYDFLYRNIHLHPKLSDTKVYEKCLMALLDGVYKHALVAIPHLNFEATVIKIAGCLGD